RSATMSVHTLPGGKTSPSGAFRCDSASRSARQRASVTKTGTSSGSGASSATNCQPSSTKCPFFQRGIGQNPCAKVEGNRPPPGLPLSGGGDQAAPPRRHDGTVSGDVATALLPLKGGGRE